MQRMNIMNQRIKEMWKQAEDFAEQDLARRKSEVQPFYQPGEYDDMIQKKFAELIIKECAGQVIWSEATKIHNHFETVE